MALLWWILVPLGLFVLALAVYWPFINTFFALDDFTWVRVAQNADVARTVRDAFASPDPTPFQRPTPFWRPLVDIYFVVGWRLFGDHTTGWHLANLVLHSLNASLLAFLSWRLTRSAAVGIAAAVLFLLLPTYEFAVTWISSVTELLGGFFYMLGLVLYLTFLRSSGRRWPAYWGAFAALFFALLAKESTISFAALLAVLVLVERQPSTASDARRRLIELMPFAALTGAYIMFRYTQQYDEASSIGLFEIGNHAWGNLWRYLEHLMLPLRQNRGDWVLWVQPVAATLLVLAGITMLWARRRVMSFVFVWMLLALVPYVFILGGAVPRYTYLAAMPLSLLVVLMVSEAIAWLRPRVDGRMLFGGLAVAVVLLGYVVANETRDRQGLINGQARLSEQLYNDVPALCGPLPRESTILVQNSPIFDITNDRVIMTLNVAYRDVFVTSVDSEEPAPPEILEEVDCAVLYEASTRSYARID